jgi:uncharacterized membrane protein
MYWWFILALLASILWAVAVIVDKFVLTHYIKDAFSYQIFMTIPLISPVLVLFTFASFHDYLAFYLISLVIGMILGLMFVLYNKALLIEEVSRVTPLFYITPLFVLFFSSLFLGEYLSQNEYIGFGLLVFSAILVSFRKSELKYMALSPALLLVLALDLILAGKDVIAKFMFSYIDPTFRIFQYKLPIYLNLYMAAYHNLIYVLFHIEYLCQRLYPLCERIELPHSIIAARTWATLAL